MNIYIGNMSSRLKEEHIRQLFEGFGEVISVKIIKDMKNGISKGLGFIEMKYDAEGKLAIEKLNKCELDGKKIFVSKAKNPTSKQKSKK